MHIALDILQALLYKMGGTLIFPELRPAFFVRADRSGIRVKGFMLISLFHKCSMMDGLVVAYIDPGSGSILLQFLFASAVGAVIYFRKFISALVRSMREKFSRKAK